MIGVSCAHPNKTFSIHTSCLSLVPTLSTFCSTPPPSWTPSPQTLTGIRSNPCALRQERMDSLAIWPHNIPPHPSESFVKNQIACLVRTVLCERRLGRMSSLLHYLLFSFTFFFCNVFSVISAFTGFFHIFCPFSVQRNVLFFLNKLENTTSPF